MPPIIDAVTTVTAPEERLYFKPVDVSHALIVVSGYQLAYTVKGDEDEDHTSEYEVHMTIGPYCHGIQHVSPLAPRSRRSITPIPMRMMRPVGMSRSARGASFPGLTASLRAASASC